MIKKWNQFIVEFVDNSGNDYIGAKMQELKDLVESISNGQNFIYEWENKNDHQLLVNFSTGELSIRYEFDIDDLILTKVVADKVDFTDNVESIDEGLDMIEKDIQLILGISESYRPQWDSSIKENQLEEIIENIDKITKLDISGNTSDIEGLIERLENELSGKYDVIVPEQVIDMILFNNPNDNRRELVGKIIELGDRVMNKYGTEPRQVLNAFEDALRVINKEFNLEPEEKLEEKYIKTFESFNERFKTVKVKLSGCEVEVLDANPNNNDGGVQIDGLTIMVNGDEEYNFEIATAISGDIYVDYETGDGGDFEEHFGLESFERMKSEYDNPKPSESYLELRNFLEQNDDSCVGDSTEIDGFEIEITDFSHRGGKEFGYLEVTINGEEFQLDMEQDATGSGLHSYVSFQSDEDESKAKEMGFNIKSDRSQNHFFEEYDRICTAKRP